MVVLRARDAAGLSTIGLVIRLGAVGASQVRGMCLGAKRIFLVLAWIAAQCDFEISMAILESVNADRSWRSQHGNVHQ